MKKDKCFWLYKSVSDDEDTWTACDVDGDDEDWHAKKGIYVIEKEAFDEERKYSDELTIKMVEAMKIHKLQREQIDKLVSALEKIATHRDRSFLYSKFAQQALADFKGEDRCPCGGIILADTEDFETPLCHNCYETKGEE